MINNKTQEGYYLLFNKIKSIISIENTKKLNLQTYTIDFEIALINDLNLVFKQCRGVGWCYYHYCRNIYKEAYKLKLLDDNDNQDLSLLNDILSIPFQLENDKHFYDKLILKYSKIERYIEFISYLNLQWKKFYLNGILNYKFLTK